MDEIAFFTYDSRSRDLLNELYAALDNYHALLRDNAVPLTHQTVAEAAVRTDEGQRLCVVAIWTPEPVNTQTRRAFTEVEAAWQALLVAQAPESAIPQRLVDGMATAIAVAATRDGGSHVYFPALLREISNDFEMSRIHVEELEYPLAGQSPQRSRGPDLAALFRPSAIGGSETGQPRTQSYSQSRRIAESIGGRRQRAAARQRAEAAAQAAAEVPQVQIDWYSDLYWLAPDPSGRVVAYEIRHMEDQHLWQTIIWLARNVEGLYLQYRQTPGLESAPDLLKAKYWLREQTVFRALLREAIQRRLTFPDDVYHYLTQYVLAKGSTEIRATRPWRDPEAAFQHDDLSAFLSEPTSVPQTVNVEAEYGKQLRDIDLG